MAVSTTPLVASLTDFFGGGEPDVPRERDRDRFERSDVFFGSGLVCFDDTSLADVFALFAVFEHFDDDDEVLDVPDDEDDVELSLSESESLLDGLESRLLLLISPNKLRKIHMALKKLCLRMVYVYV